MKFSALASGSSGNCFYIENNKKSILIDAGISCKQICERLSWINADPKNISGIFITHEHSDHIRGVEVFSKTFNIPVFATKKTFENSNLLNFENEQLKSNLNFVKNNETISLNGFEVEAFSKSHKAGDPVSYTIHGKKSISVITDAGYCCKNIIKKVSESDFLCLEANHDVEMLETGSYPYHLKKWIKGENGHLSNLQSALCVMEHASPKLKNLVLSHLSRTNNTSEIALKTFKSLLKERRDLSPEVIVSEREKPTEIINI